MDKVCEPPPFSNKINETTRSVVDESAEPCLVCGVPTTMLHLQVNTCRACAAFFRRSSVGIHNSYRCQKNKGNCDVTIKIKGKPLCRLCRYKKCIEIGMKLSRTDKEISKNTEKEKEQEKKQIIEDPKPLPATISAKEAQRRVDFAKIFQIVDLIFEAKMPLVLNQIQNHTKEFSFLLSNFVETLKPQGQLTPMNKENDDNLRLQFLETYFLKIAQLLSQFQPFAVLPLSEKRLLHKKFWQIFHILERCFQTCQYFGNDIHVTKVVVDPYHYFEFEQIKTDEIKKIGNEVFLVPFVKKIQSILHPFKKANVTLFEFAYMCQIALWSCYDINELNPFTQKLADEILNKTSNDMHDYFINELRMPYYATRQSQLFRIVHNVEFIVRLKTQLLTAKEIFNFGDYAFSYCAFEQSYYDFINKHL